MSNETTNWEDKKIVMELVNRGFFIFGGLALFIVSLLLLISICRSPQRDKDPLNILIVVLMLFYGINETSLNYELQLYGYFDERTLLSYLTSFVGYYTFLMVHWLFPMQFIQTGLIIQKFRKNQGHALSRAENGESPY